MSKPSGGVDAAALMLTPEAPYPAVGGGPLRVASLVEYLKLRGGVDLLIFDQDSALKLPYHSKSLAARSLRNLVRAVRRVPPLVDRFAGFTIRPSRRYSLVLIEHFWCAPYVTQLRQFANRIVLDLHNVESILHARSAEVSPWPQSVLHRIFCDAARDLERRYLPEFDTVLVASEQDAGYVSEVAPAARTLVCPNTIPAAPLPEVPEEDAIAFSGNFEYYPNASGLDWFKRMVWPVLAARHPRLECRLIGRGAPAGTSPRILAAGPVDNAVRELARAKVAIVPLLAGSGTRLKIVEAWAAGRAVVSTTIGAEGLPVRHGENALLADTAGAFADRVSELLLLPDLRRKLGCAGRSIYESEFTWQSAWEQLDRAGFCSPSPSAGYYTGSL